MKKDSLASPWKKAADNWENYYAPPGRPSPEDCKHYSNFIERASGGKFVRALVLGATPEVRNVLHKFNIETTILDINLEMILAMNRFVKGWEKDIIIRDNWIGGLLADNYYDIILGDLTWANVPRDQWAVFNKNMSRILKPGGYYIQRVTVMPENWKKESTKDVLTRYGKLPYIAQRHFELFLDLLIDSYDSVAKIFSTAKVRESIKPFLKNNSVVIDGKINAKATKLIRRIFAFWGNDNKTWQLDLPSELRKQISPYFSILEEVTSKDYLVADASPFWFCQVKK